MSSHENESEDQSEPVETDQTVTNNETKDGETYTATPEETDVTEEIETEEEICEDQDEIPDEKYPEEVQEINYSFSPLDLISMIYNNPYYWAIFKSTLLFLLALKMARECKMLRIPMKEYKPFNRHYF